MSKGEGCFLALVIVAVCIPLCWASYQLGTLERGMELHRLKSDLTRSGQAKYELNPKNGEVEFTVTDWRDMQKDAYDAAMIRATNIRRSMGLECSCGGSVDEDRQ